MLVACFDSGEPADDHRDRAIKPHDGRRLPMWLPREVPHLTWRRETGPS